MPFPDPELTPSAELFAEFLARREQRAGTDFDAFCAEHPEHASGLRELEQHWRLVDSTLQSSEGAPREERYELGAELARGGMGVVVQAFDRFLQRKVAIKLGGSGTEDARGLLRFLDEARITGQLEHPGVVPIYDLGMNAQSRFYFTMPLLRGRTFREVIDLVHAGDTEWTLPRALGVLLAVCDAVASAHAKGVIHRDLKPGNVIVGRFGETWVVDWGLARVLSETDRKDIRIRDVVTASSVVHAKRRELADSDPDSPLITMDGDVVGTPSYMPPEQARGEVERIGPRGDVYSAGAMLYHLLGGAMPYAPKGARVSARTVLARVLDGPPRPLLEIAPGAPAELVAICGKAMAREPDARYADMRELAADLRAFLELRVVGAYGGGTWIELSKWVRRNRAVTGAGFVAVLALVAGLAVSVIHGRRADAAATVADANFQLASEAVTELIRIGSIELENVPQLDAVRRQMLRRAVAFQELFVDARSNDLKVRERAAIASIRLGYLQRQLGSLDEARASLLAGIARLEALVRELPHRHDLGASLLWGHNDLASVLMDRGDVEGSLARLDVALKVADDLTRQQPTVPEYRRRRAGTLHNRAIACIKLGRHEEALALAREEIGIRKSLAAEFPDDALDSGHLAQAHTQCASSLIPLQRAGEALAELEEAVRLHTEVLARMPQDRDCRARAAHSWGELGILHKARGAFPKAQHATEQAIALRRALAQDFPQTPSYHSSLGAGLNNLAMLHVDIGDDAKARVAILEAIGAQSRALRASPDQPQFQTYLANHYGVLFWVLGRQGDHRELASRADEFRGLALPRKAQTLHGLGQQFLHCAALLREDQVLAEAERDRLAEEYTRRGIETLSEAFDEGWREWNLSELAHPALRGREDFRKLFARVKAAEAVPREPERRR